MCFTLQRPAKGLLTPIAITWCACLNLILLALSPVQFSPLTYNMFDSILAQCNLVCFPLPLTCRAPSSADISAAASAAQSARTGVSGLSPAFSLSVMFLLLNIDCWNLTISGQKNLVYIYIYWYTIWMKQRAHQCLFNLHYTTHLPFLIKDFSFYSLIRIHPCPDKDASAAPYTHTGGGVRQGLNWAKRDAGTGAPGGPSGRRLVVFVIGGIVRCVCQGANLR